MAALQRPVVLLAVLMGCAVLLEAQSAPTPSSSATLRVVTYNIHHGEGMDGVFDMDRLATIITGAQPDLVALQEVDQGTLRAGGLHELDELQARTGLHGVFGKAMDFDDGAYGVAVLSRFPIVRSTTHMLPGASDREPRSALTVDVRVSDEVPLVHFTSTHLDQARDTETKLAQAEYLSTRLIADDTAPAILAGDMNSRGESEALVILGWRWTDMFVGADPSDPSLAARRWVDYILARPTDRWRALTASVVNAPPASDHRPMLAVVELLDTH